MEDVGEAARICDDSLEVIVSIVDMLNNPFGEKKDADAWFFFHANDHRDILVALQKKFPTSTFTDYQIYPFNPHAMQEWLIRHQSMHNAFNGFLNYDGSDLNRVDFNDPQQQEEWVSQNYTEHYSARVALGI